MQSVLNSERNITPAIPPAVALVACPGVLFAHAPASAPELYHRAYELAVQSVLWRFRAGLFEPSLN